MVKRLLQALGLLVVVVVGAGLAFVEFDLSFDELKDTYVSPSSQFIDLPDGSRAHVRDEGNRNGYPLILVHGSTASLHTWEPWVKELGNTYRIVSMDLPGHGLTGATPSGDYSRDAMVEFVRDVMDALGIDRAALAGNSMGGGVVAAFAEDYPTRVSHLILISSAGLPPEGEAGKPPLAMRLARMPVASLITRYITPRSLIEDGLRKVIVDQSLVTEAMVSRYHDLLLYDGNREATRIRFAAYRPDDRRVADRLGEIEAKVLILWGDKDPLIPVSHAHRFKALMPEAELIIYENVGHVAMEEVPARSAADVRAFIGQP